MIAQQQSFFPEEMDDRFTPDDWETPDWLAKAIASEVSDCQTVIEVGAGRGRISKYLPPISHCLEINRHRFRQGQKNAPQCIWHCSSFFDFRLPAPVDAVVGNPPFSRIAEVISHALTLIHPQGKIVLLMPCDTMHKTETLAAIALPFQFTAKPIVGRVGYIKDGVAFNQRRVYDSIFTLRHGEGTWVKR